MKKLQILGTGCAACNKLAELTALAARELKLDHELEKVTAIDKIMAFNVVATPALVVDGNVLVSGTVPSLDELKAMIQSAGSS
jgi:small redox-active disulfide protein 2